MATLDTIKRKAGAAWRLNWTHPQTGRRERRVIGDTRVVAESDARAALAALEYELATSNPVLNLGQRRAPGTPWATFIERYLAWHEQQYPDSHWRIRLIAERHLTPYLSGFDLESLRPEHVEAYLATRHVRPGTSNKELRTLKAMLAKAVEWKLLPYHPITHVKGPRDTRSNPRQFYTSDELCHLYAVSSSGHVAIWKLLANTGLRRGEALHLKWSDVTATAITVRSTEEARTKSARWRHVPLSPGARTALSLLRGHGADFVLPEITPHALTRAFSRTLARAGLDGNLHLLRHTFISHLLMSGSASLFEVGRIVGHSNEYMTEHYAHFTPDYLQSAVKGINL